MIVIPLLDWSDCRAAPAIAAGAARRIDLSVSSSAALLVARASRLELSSTWSSEKLPTFWLGGNSLNVARNFPTYCLRRHQQEDVVDPPVRCSPCRMVGLLERIGAQVEELGQAQRHERLLPDIEAVGALLGEDDLPVVVAQRHQRAVVVEVEELVARVGRLAGERSR